MSETEGKSAGVPAVAEDKSVMPTDMEEFAGDGMDEADASAFAIPFITILQTNSPQCDPDNGAYIEGAKAGDIFNTVTFERWTAEEGILVVPAYYRRRMVEWVKREDGGGYVGEHLWSTELMKRAHRNDRGRDELENGHEIVDTRYHFCVLATKNGFERVILTLSSTQLKKSRKWMSTMDSFKREGKNGKFYTPPTYAGVWRLKTVPEQNAKGSWRGWGVEYGKDVSNEDLFQMARKFCQEAREGGVQVGAPPEGTVAEGEGQDGVAF